MQETTHEGHETATSHDFIDPVCGMHVSEASLHRQRVGSVEYRFCSAHCHERFSKNPTAFLQEDAQR